MSEEDQKVLENSSEMNEVSTLEMNNVKESDQAFSNSDLADVSETQENPLTAKFKKIKQEVAAKSMSNEDKLKMFGVNASKDNFGNAEDFRPNVTPQEKADYQNKTTPEQRQADWERRSNS